MNFGVGRPAKIPEVTEIRELSLEEIRAFKPGREAAVLSFKDSHHRLARLIAMGLRPFEVAEASGYSLVHITIMKQDPSFQELIEHYRTQVDDGYKDAAGEYYSTIGQTRIASARLINDAVLSAEPGDIPLRTLVSIHADVADRTGFGKRTTVDVNVDWASRLDKAIADRDQRLLAAPVDAEFTEVQQEKVA